MTDSAKLDLLLDKVSSMDEKISSMDEKISSLDERLTSVESNVTDIRMVLENVINKNIMRVAEGHLDLNRKLQDALKSDGEKELLTVRVSILESEVKKIKERLATA